MTTLIMTSPSAASKSAAGGMQAQETTSRHLTTATTPVVSRDGSSVNDDEEPTAPPETSHPLPESRATAKPAVVKKKGLKMTGKRRRLSKDNEDDEGTVVSTSSAPSTTSTSSTLVSSSSTTAAANLFIPEHDVVLGNTHTPTLGTKIYRQVRQLYAKTHVSDTMLEHMWTQVHEQIRASNSSHTNAPRPQFWYNAAYVDKIVPDSEQRQLRRGGGGKGGQWYQLATPDAIKGDIKSAPKKSRTRAKHVFHLTGSSLDQVCHAARQVCRDWINDDARKARCSQGFEQDLAAMLHWRDQVQHQNACSGSARLQAFHVVQLEAALVSMVNEMGNAMVERHRQSLLLQDDDASPAAHNQDDDPGGSSGGDGAGKQTGNQMLAAAASNAPPSTSGSRPSRSRRSGPLQQRSRKTVTAVTAQVSMDTDAASDVQHSVESAPLPQLLSLNSFDYITSNLLDENDEGAMMWLDDGDLEWQQQVPPLDETSGEIAAPDPATEADLADPLRYLDNDAKKRVTLPPFKATWKTPTDTFALPRSATASSVYQPTWTNLETPTDWWKSLTTFSVGTTSTTGFKRLPPNRSSVSSQQSALLVQPASNVLGSDLSLAGHMLTTMMAVFQASLIGTGGSSGSNSGRSSQHRGGNSRSHAGETSSSSSVGGAHYMPPASRSPRAFPVRVLQTFYSRTIRRVWGMPKPDNSREEYV